VIPRLHFESVFLIALSAIIQGEGNQDEVFLFAHNWVIDWRLRPLANGWNSTGEPMAFETTSENAEDAIERISPDRTANATLATVTKTTWTG
jgi:hypothetical protein